MQFNEYDILSNAGKISRKVADNLAKEELKKYRVIQDREFKSDFDKLTDFTIKKKSYTRESVILVVNLIYCDLPNAKAISEKSEDVDTHNIYINKTSLMIA